MKPGSGNLTGVVRRRRKDRHTDIFTEKLGLGGFGAH